MNALRTARRLAITAALSGLAATATVGLGAGTAAATGSELVYTGQASITIATYDYCDFTTGQRRPVGERTYTGPVTLTVSDPLSDGEGGTEGNPFHFTLQTDQQNGTGAFSISSAHVFTTPQTFRNVALPYWTAVYDGETNALQAELTEDHREEAAAYNLVNVDQQLIPCNPQMGTIPMVAAMAEGTRLAGTLGDSDGSIELAGTSSDGMYDFHVATELVRSG